jgi:hypothetical protein
LCENMVKFLLSWCAIIPLSSFLLPVSWVYRPPFQPATGYMLIRDLFHLHKEDIGLSSLPLKKKWCINYEKLVYTHDHMKKKQIILQNPLKLILAHYTNYWSSSYSFSSSFLWWSVEFISFFYYIEVIIR